MDVSRLFQSLISKSIRGLEKDMNLLQPKGLVAGRIMEINTGNDALVDFTKFKAFVRLPFNASPGEPLQILFSEKDAPVLIQPENTASGKKEMPRGQPVDRIEIIPKSAFLKNLTGQVKTGDLLSARATGFTRQGKMLMDFGHFKAFAKIDFPVKADQMLSLRVSDVTQGVKFEVYDARIKPAHGRNHLLQTPDPITLKDLKEIKQSTQRVLYFVQSKDLENKMPEPVKMALKQIDSFFKPLAIGQDNKIMETGLRAFVKDSGLYFEKKLEAAILKMPEEKPGQTISSSDPPERVAQILSKDVKPNLMIVKKAIESGELLQLADDKKSILSLKSTVTKLLSHIEFQQTQAVVRQSDSEIFQMFSHVLHLPDAARKAELKVYYPKKNKSGRENTPRISILLEMDKLGEIRTDLWMVNQDLNLTFYVRNEKVKSVIQSEIKQIRDALFDSFDHVLINVVKNESKIEQFDQKDSGYLGANIVDLKV